ncbi:hypothetical protein L9F63_027969 [Diploptera punctata]|uniref:Thaumatin-like protein n=1 Tax=Diploptera punctata TaxID=6984 RepID=A0AAD8A0W3_DIPPU|nr:hypothetical protein L9F63_027969 [Diploptera punctata]
MLFCTLQLTKARLFRIHNNLGDRIFVGILGNAGKLTPDNGGFELDSQQERDVEVQDDWAGRFWARTGCDDSGNCQTGDCNGQVECGGIGGTPPATLVEITLRGDNNQDFYDISLVDGFNVKASITPADQQGSGYHCTTADCSNDLNPNCPGDLQVTSGDGISGCKSSCVVASSNNDPNKDIYCCTGQNDKPDTGCTGGESATYFQDNCPNAYSFAYNDGSSTFTCDTGDYPYDITFG